MPRDKTGKNRKFGHHKDKSPHTGNLSEEDILKMLSNKKPGQDDEGSDHEEDSDEEEEGFYFPLKLATQSSLINPPMVLTTPQYMVPSHPSPLHKTLSF